jgi:hypothetical protein
LLWFHYRLLALNGFSDLVLHFSETRWFHPLFLVLIQHYVNPESKDQSFPSDMIEHHPTPNPDSLKFTSSTRSFIKSGMLIVSNQLEAEPMPLTRALFEIEGVTNIFVLPEFLTVTKHPNVSWSRILSKVEEILEEHITRQ